jgi:FkbM family methyltransferase
MKYCRLQQPEKSSRASNVIGLLLALPQVVTALRQSNSQLGQDLFVLCELGLKKDGFFVEFGATNGVNLSNTCLLEKQFGWTGIVAEPAIRWHKDLTNNRKCHIETNCVWRESNAVLTFNETDSGEYSTIESYSSSDVHNEKRKSGKTYSINTISLEDMLDKYNAPRVIDYLSIDTEGSEYEILSNFNFDKYKFRTITCEHNFTPDREKIFSLLTANGYVRKLEGSSRFDDWYVRAV